MQEDYIVTNPETNKRYNCTKILERFINNYSTIDRNTFNEYIQLFNSFVEWDDTIDKQIDKLHDIFKDHGLGSSFQHQLNSQI